MTDKTKPKNYIISEDTLYEEVVNPLYVTYKKFSLPVANPNPRWTGPKIPFALWQEMVAWCQVTQAKFKSEALVFLFLDVDKSEWKAWYLPQITNGMTVKADDKHEDYKEQRKQFPDLQFGSLHHHCTAAAFASSTDKEDEQNREGLHFTVGDIGSEEHSLHYRFCIEGACYEGEAHDVIDYALSIKTVPNKYRDKIHADMVKEPVQDFEKWDFEKELKNVTKPAYSPPKFQTNSRQSTLPTGIGGEMNQTTIWDEDGERTTGEEIRAFIDNEFSLTADIGELLEEYDFKATYELDKDLTKILKIWEKDYVSVPAKDKQEDLIDWAVYILTGINTTRQSPVIQRITKNAIRKWVDNYNNERI